MGDTQKRESVVTENFRFEFLTRHLKITPKDPALLVQFSGLPEVGKPHIKLSMRMWEILGGSAWKPIHKVLPAYAKEHIYDYLVYRSNYYLSTWLRCALENVGLCEEVEFQHPQRHLYASRVKTALSDLAVQIRKELPECPSEDMWVPVTKTANHESVRLTKPQQESLKKWSKCFSDAVPVGETSVQTSRWEPQERGRTPTYNALLRMRLIEPGTRGVNLDEEGKLTFANPASPCVSLVYRLTILGALMAGDAE